MPRHPQGSQGDSNRAVDVSFSGVITDESQG